MKLYRIIERDTSRSERDAMYVYVIAKDTQTAWTIACEEQARWRFVKASVIEEMGDIITDTALTAAVAKIAM